MRFLRFSPISLGVLLVASCWPRVTSAHEAYVLSSGQFQSGLANRGPNLLTALTNPTNLNLTIAITIGTIVVFAIAFLIRHSQFGRRWDKKLKSLAVYGPLIVRLSIAIALASSAYLFVIFGPELSLKSLPAPFILQAALGVMSVLILFGVITEFAAIAGLIIFGVASWHFGAYVLTYLNYFGELVALAIFGSRELSLDRFISGPNSSRHKWQQYEIVIVRVGYGLALLYAAIDIKWIHSSLTLDVVRDYHLTQFHYLFPSDPLLVVLGAALAETAIATCIIIGLQTRLVVLVSLFYITLSLLFFREAVWPHLMLYGISLSLLINGPGPLSIDEWIDTKLLARHKVTQSAPISPAPAE